MHYICTTDSYICSSCSFLCSFCKQGGSCPSSSKWDHTKGSHTSSHNNVGRGYRISRNVRTCSHHFSYHRSIISYCYNLTISWNKCSHSNSGICCIKCCIFKSLRSLCFIVRTCCLYPHRTKFKSRSNEHSLTSTIRHWICHS